MPKFRITACIMGTIAFCGGCALNIEKMPVDDTAFDNPQLKKIQEAENAPAESLPRLVVAPQNDNQHSNHNGQLLGTYLDTNFSLLSGFVVVPRAELGALNTENALTALAGKSGNSTKINKADYLITYQFVSAKRNSRNERKYAGDGNYQYVTYYTNQFKGRISVLEIATSNRAFTQIYEVSIPTGTNQSDDWDQAAEMLSKKIAMDFYARYGLPTYVKETRGNGQVALLSDNYLTRNLPEGTRVFFAGDKGASGKVYSGLWVEVDNYKNANVRKNQLVTIEMPQ